MKKIRINKKQHKQLFRFWLCLMSSTLLSNVFILKTQEQVFWSRWTVADPSSMQGNLSPIITYFQNTDHQDYICSWRRIRRDTSFVEELWIFAFHSPSCIPTAIDNLLQEEFGSIDLKDSESIKQQADKVAMLFGALNHKLRKLLFHHKFVPLGSFSVHVPSNRAKPNLNSDPSSLSLSWTLFLSNIHICVRVFISYKRLEAIQDVDRKHINKRLSSTRAKSTPVIAGPLGFIGTWNGQSLHRTDSTLSAWFPFYHLSNVPTKEFPQQESKSYTISIEGRSFHFPSFLLFCICPSHHESHQRTILLSHCNETNKYKGRKEIDAFSASRDFSVSPATPIPQPLYYENFVPLPSPKEQSPKGDNKESAITEHSVASPALGLRSKPNTPSQTDTLLPNSKPATPILRSPGISAKQLSPRTNHPAPSPSLHIGTPQSGLSRDNTLPSPSPGPSASPAPVVKVVPKDWKTLSTDGGIDFNFWFSQLDDGEEGQPTTTTQTQPATTAPPSRYVQNTHNPQHDNLDEEISKSLLSDPDIAQDLLGDDLPSSRETDTIMTTSPENNSRNTSSMPSNTPVENQPMSDISFDSLSKDIENISHQLQDSAEQVAAYRKKISDPMKSSVKEIPPAYRCPDTYKPLSITPLHLTVSYTPTNNFLVTNEKQSDSYSAYSKNLFTASNGALYTTQNKSKAVHKSPSVEDSVSASSSPSSGESDSDSHSEVSVSTDTIQTLVGNRAMNPSTLRRLHFGMRHLPAHGFDSVNLSLLLSDVLSFKSISYPISLTSTTSHLVPCTTVLTEAFEQKRDCYLELILQQAVVPGDVFEPGNLSSGLVPTLQGLVAEQERQRTGSSFEKLSEHTMETFEIFSEKIQHMADPLYTRGAKQVRSSHKILLSFQRMISSFFSEAEGPLPCDKLCSLQNILRSDDPMETEEDNASQLTSESLFAPFVLVGNKASWLEVKPQEAITMWEKTRLRPYVAKKSFSYFVLCPSFSHDSPNSSIDMNHTPNILQFFKELSSMYDTCNLGSLQAVNNSKYSNGLIWVPMQDSRALDRNAQYEFQLQSFKRACDSLSRDIACHTIYADSCLLIYIVNPFSHCTSAFDLTACLASIRSVLSYHGQNVSFQMINYNYIFSPPPCGHAALLKEIAFSLFNKCRRISYLSSENQCIYKLYEPLFVLSTPPSSAKNLHCAYRRTFDDKWILVVFTDTKGELLEQRVISVSSDNLPENTAEYNDPSLVLDSCVKLLLHLPAPMSYHNLSIGKFGRFSEKELTQWFTLLQNSKNIPKVSNVHLLSLALKRDFQLYRFQQNGDGKPRKFLPFTIGKMSAVAFYPPPMTHLSDLNLCKKLSSSITIHKDKVSLPVEISLFFSTDQHSHSQSIRMLTNEFQALSWLNISAGFTKRTSILPLHFTVLSRSSFLLSGLSVPVT